MHPCHYVALICFLPEQTLTDTTENHYEGIIDSGRELALMFDILKDQTTKINQVILFLFLRYVFLTFCNAQKLNFGDRHGGAERI